MASPTARTLILGFALCVAVGLGVSADGTGVRQSSAPPTDPIPALLAEVHALRLAMEQGAAVAPRVQLTLARLNIEEQRIVQLAAQLDRARHELTQAQFGSQKDAEDLAAAEKRLQTEVDEKERRGWEIGISDLKNRIKRQGALEDQLRIREGDALQALSTE